MHGKVPLPAAAVESGRSRRDHVVEADTHADARSNAVRREGAPVRGGVVAEVGPPDGAEEPDVSCPGSRARPPASANRSPAKARYGWLWRSAATNEEEPAVVPCPRRHRPFRGDGVLAGGRRSSAGLRPRGWVARRVRTRTARPRRGVRVPIRRGVPAGSCGRASLSRRRACPRRWSGRDGRLPCRRRARVPSRVTRFGAVPTRGLPRLARRSRGRGTR